MWLGTPTVTTPFHYDFVHNFYTQLVGRKRFVLAPRENYWHMHVFSSLHPSSRMSQLNINNETHWQKHAAVLGALRNVREVILEPGDILYIPPMCFHYVSVVGNETSVSVSTHNQGRTTRTKRNVQCVRKTGVEAELYERMMHASDEVHSLRQSSLPLNVAAFRLFAQHFVADDAARAALLRRCHDSHWSVEHMVDDLHSVGLLEQLAAQRAVLHQQVASAPSAALSSSAARQVAAFAESMAHVFDNAVDVAPLAADIVRCHALEGVASRLVGALNVPTMLTETTK